MLRVGRRRCLVHARVQGCRRTSLAGPWPHRAFRGSGITVVGAPEARGFVLDCCVLRAWASALSEPENPAGLGPVIAFMWSPSRTGGVEGSTSLWRASWVRPTGFCSSMTGSKQEAKPRPSESRSRRWGHPRRNQRDRGSGPERGPRSAERGWSGGGLTDCRSVAELTCSSHRWNATGDSPAVLLNELVDNGFSRP